MANAASDDNDPLESVDQLDHRQSQNERRRLDSRPERDFERSCGIIVGLLLLLVGTCLFVRGAGVDADIGGRSYQATGCPELVLNENGPYNIASVHFSSATFRVHPHSCRYVTTDQLDGVPLNRLCKAALTPMDNRAVTRVDELCNGCVKGGNKIRAWSTTLRACRCILLISVFLSLLSYMVSAFAPSLQVARVIGVGFSTLTFLAGIVCEFGVRIMSVEVDGALRSVLLTTPFFDRLSTCPDYTNLRKGAHASYTNAALIMFFLASLCLLYFSIVMKSVDAVQSDESRSLIASNDP